MDALSEVLKVLHLTSGIFLDAEFSAPWCVDSAPGKDKPPHLLLAAEHVTTYHLVTEGACLACLSGTSDVLQLSAGDLIMFPHGDEHRMGSDLQLAPVFMRDFVELSPGGGLKRIRHGGDGVRSRFICGYMACDKRLCKPLLDALPRMLSVSLSADPATSWMVGALQHGAAETHSPQPGNEAIMGRLSELLFVEALRHFIRGLPEHQQGWLAGLRDPFVGRALALLHAEPARNWEVEMLARESGVSRSTLADRFVSLIGEPPMQYLAGWRLALAAQSLSKTNDAIARIAESVGYDSEAAFSRAFKREFGTPPATWRRATRLAKSTNPR